MVYFLIILVAGTLGLSLTRTPALRSENPVVFVLAAAGFAAIALLIFHHVRERIALSLPPARQLRGLKIFMVGFLLALCGWLIAAFASFEAGIRVAVLGFLVCASGMFVHFYLWATRK